LLAFFPFVCFWCNRWWSRLIVLSSSVIIAQQNHHLSAERLRSCSPFSSACIWLSNLFSSKQNLRMDWNAMWYLMPGLFHGLVASHGCTASPPKGTPPPRRAAPSSLPLP
jgi:hypothetical protein